MCAPLNIPTHTNCKNCGACCDIVPASTTEIEAIKKHLKENLYILKEMSKERYLKCPFRNEEKKKCLIYPVRPLICRLMGVAKGMTCKNGNSANIDGYNVMDKSLFESPQCLNYVRWDE